MTKLTCLDWKRSDHDGIPFEEKMEKLTKELLEQFEEGERLERQIVENMNKFQMHNTTKLHG